MNRALKWPQNPRFPFWPKKGVIVSWVSNNTSCLGCLASIPLETLGSFYSCCFLFCSFFLSPFFSLQGSILMCMQTCWTGRIPLMERLYAPSSGENVWLILVEEIWIRIWAPLHPRKHHPVRRGDHSHPTCRNRGSSLGRSNEKTSALPNELTGQSKLSLYPPGRCFCYNVSNL